MTNKDLRSRVEEVQREVDAIVRDFYKNKNVMNVVKVEYKVVYYPNNNRLILRKVAGMFLGMEKSDFRKALKSRFETEEYEFEVREMPALDKQIAFVRNGRVRTTRLYNHAKDDFVLSRIK